jgi:hypothetical protein
VRQSEPSRAEPPSKTLAGNVRSLWQAQWNRVHIEPAKAEPREPTAAPTRCLPPDQRLAPFRRQWRVSQTNRCGFVIFKAADMIDHSVVSSLFFFFLLDFNYKNGCRCTSHRCTSCQSIIIQSTCRQTHSRAKDSSALLVLLSPGSPPSCSAPHLHASVCPPCPPVPPQTLAHSLSLAG